VDTAKGIFQSAQQPRHQRLGANMRGVSRRPQEALVQGAHARGRVSLSGFSVDPDALATTAKPFGAMAEELGTYARSAGGALASAAGSAGEASLAGELLAAVEAVSASLMGAVSHLEAVSSGLSANAARYLETDLAEQAKLR
jgi:hypothetical protein